VNPSRMAAFRTKREEPERDLRVRVITPPG
jgi:hypothetical protein